MIHFHLQPCEILHSSRTANTCRCTSPALTECKLHHFQSLQNSWDEVPPENPHHSNTLKYKLLYSPACSNAYPNKPISLDSSSCTSHFMLQSSTNTWLQKLWFQKEIGTSIGEWWCTVTKGVIPLRRKQKPKQVLVVPWLGEGDFFGWKS
jgi:hypothetical protein